MVPHSIKVERTRLGVRQYRLAAALGVPQTTVCAWENGRRPMTSDQERRALEALRVLAQASRDECEPNRAVA